MTLKRDVWGKDTAGEMELPVSSINTFQFEERMFMVLLIIQLSSSCVIFLGVTFMVILVISGSSSGI